MDNYYRLKGTFHECCRVEDGHCALWFGRDLTQPCANLVTYQIREGEVQGLDMEGIIIIYHMDGIGPKLSDLAKGVEEGAAYISNGANDAQKKVLEPFVRKYLEGAMWKKCLGVKFVDINLSEKNGTYRITMPFGEVEMSLAIGGDGKNPIRLENATMTFLNNVKFCNTKYWKYHDYGKNLEYHSTSGAIADFAIEGEQVQVN